MASRATSTEQEGTSASLPISKLYFLLMISDEAALCLFETFIGSGLLRDADGRFYTSEEFDKQLLDVIKRRKRVRSMKLAEEYKMGSDFLNGRIQRLAELHSLLGLAELLPLEWITSDGVDDLVQGCIRELASEGFLSVKVVSERHALTLERATSLLNENQGAFLDRGFHAVTDAGRIVKYYSDAFKEAQLDKLQTAAKELHQPVIMSSFMKQHIELDGDVLSIDAWKSLGKVSQGVFFSAEYLKRQRKEVLEIWKQNRIVLYSFLKAQYPADDPKMLLNSIPLNDAIYLQTCALDSSYIMNVQGKLQKDLDIIILSEDIPVSCDKADVAFFVKHLKYDCYLLFNDAYLVSKNFIKRLIGVLEPELKHLALVWKRMGFMAITEKASKDKHTKYWSREEFQDYLGAFNALGNFMELPESEAGHLTRLIGIEIYSACLSIMSNEISNESLDDSELERLYLVEEFERLQMILRSFGNFSQQVNNPKLTDRLLRSSLKKFATPFMDSLLREVYRQKTRKSVDLTSVSEQARALNELSCEIRDDYMSLLDKMNQLTVDAIDAWISSVKAVKWWSDADFTKESNRDWKQQYRVQLQVEIARSNDEKHFQSFTASLLLLSKFGLLTLVPHKYVPDCLELLAEDLKAVKIYSTNAFVWLRKAKHQQDAPIVLLLSNKVSQSLSSLAHSAYLFS